MRRYSQVLSHAFILIAAFASAQVTVTTFEGIDASEVNGATLGVDPNGAIGTKQYLEWADFVFQGFDKSGNPVTPLAPGDAPWRSNQMTDCYGNSGNVEVLFDHLASRWVIGRRQGKGVYFYCIAVSNTDDLTASNFKWYTYELALDTILGENSQGQTYFPDYPKIGTWGNGYYVTIDLEDVGNGYQEAGVVACAFDRASMLAGGVMRTPQCFRKPGAEPYPAHSLEPADIDGTIAPPTGEPEYFVSLQNPGKGQTTASVLNGWEMKINWTSPGESTFTGPIAANAKPYTQGCLVVDNPENTICVPEPSTAQTGQAIDSVGDRLMQRLAYRRFLGAKPYQSWLVSSTVQVGSGPQSQTGIRWYEYRGSEGGDFGTVTYNDSNYRFLPSIAQDQAANMAVGYSVSGTDLHPSIAASYLNLQQIGPPTEIALWGGTGDEENSYHWGVYSSMTVDPTDDCTFWYANEYFGTDQTGTEINWQTRISNFKLPGCP
ncbi:MAG: hypothetical protein ACLP6G_17070 [Terriglobales bacterium]